MDDNDAFTEIVMTGISGLFWYSLVKEALEYAEEKEKEDKEDGKVLQR